jgi:Ca2+-binding RTX toxin-like protein
MVDIELAKRVLKRLIGKLAFPSSMTAENASLSGARGSASDSLSSGQMASSISLSGARRTGGDDYANGNNGNDTVIGNAGNDRA